jgi:hypothetical protein
MLSSFSTADSLMLQAQSPAKYPRRFCSLAPLSVKRAGNSYFPKEARFPAVDEFRIFANCCRDKPTFQEINGKAATALLSKAPVRRLHWEKEQNWRSLFSEQALLYFFWFDEFNASRSIDCLQA